MRPKSVPLLRSGLACLGGLLLLNPMLRCRSAPAEEIHTVSVWDGPSNAPTKGPRNADLQKAAGAFRTMGPFQVGETDRATLISNGVIELGTRRDGSRISVASLLDVRRGIELLPAAADNLPLWSVLLHNPKGETLAFDSNSAGQPAAKIEIEEPSGDLLLRMAWKPARADAAGAGTIGATVEIRLARGEPYFRWRRGCFRSRKVSPRRPRRRRRPA